MIAIAGPVLASAAGRFPDLLAAAESARLNAAGVTTVSEMAFDRACGLRWPRPPRPGSSPPDCGSTRMSGPKRGSDLEPGAGDEMVRQVGIKIWSDGSPWIGNIALSFAYLDTPATRALGMACSHGGANYTGEQILEISTRTTNRAGRSRATRMATTRSQWSSTRGSRCCPRTRVTITDCASSMSVRCARTSSDAPPTWGLTCSLFVDHLYYWGDVLVDDLSVASTAGTGPPRVRRWLPVIASRSTTTVRSRRPIRCATSRTPSPGVPAAGGCWRPRSASRWRRRCAPRPSTRPGSCSVRIPSAR